VKVKTRTKKDSKIAPRWLGIQEAAGYSGVSGQTLRNWEKAGHIRFANVSPMGGRGRVLIDRIELDIFIQGFIGAPAADLAMNKGRAKQ
jgi:hypothetical protein